MDLNLFLKQNKVKQENFKYKVSKSIIDPKTNEPVEWEIKHLTTKEVNKIRAKCTTEVPVAGRAGQFRRVISDDFALKLAVQAIVCPDLYNKELQDSYDVKTPEDLLQELVDDPTDYADLLLAVQGDEKSIQEDIETAKN